jgi:hypothetical protein
MLNILLPSILCSSQIRSLFPEQLNKQCVTGPLFSPFAHTLHFLPAQIYYLAVSFLVQMNGHGAFLQVKISLKSIKMVLIEFVLVSFAILINLIKYIKSHSAILVLNIL